MTRSISLGYSPCPNDTYIFGALAQKRIAWGDFDFRITLADVEELNQQARKGRLDVSKVSIHAMVHLLKDHCLLRAGGAMGRGCGPLVVARKQSSLADLANCRMAIPGRMTTANLLLRMEGSHRGEAREMIFHEIMPAVADGRVDAGVIIHEGRFTYSQYGLRLVLDLGAWWEKETGLPLPLGGIVMKRSLGAETAHGMEEKIRQSLMFSRTNPQATWPYIREHAQEMEPQVMRDHIDMFVNDYTFDMGGEGEKAIRFMLEAAARLEGRELSTESMFCTSGAP